MRPSQFWCTSSFCQITSTWSYNSYYEFGQDCPWGKKKNRWVKSSNGQLPEFQLVFPIGLLSCLKQFFVLITCTELRDATWQLVSFSYFGVTYGYDHFGTLGKMDSMRLRSIRVLLAKLLCFQEKINSATVYGWNLDFSCLETWIKPQNFGILCFKEARFCSFVTDYNMWELLCTAWEDLNQTRATYLPISLAKKTNSFLIFGCWNITFFSITLVYDWMLYSI